MLVGWVLARIGSFCGRRPILVCVLALLIGIDGLVAIRTRLGVDTDTGDLFSASLPWKQVQARLRHAFPQNEDTLVAVVDAKAPEEADATATALADALAGDHAQFVSVWRPDASPYLNRNAFLFLDPPALQALLDQTIDAQPFLGTLAADPSLRGLSAALGLVAQGVKAGQADLGGFAPALVGFHAALAQAAAGSPQPLSWQTLLAGKLSDLAGRYRFVLIKPKLDYQSMQPGAHASAAIRAAAGRLAFVRDGSARVRITGSVALDDDEFASVAQGMQAGLAASLVLVTLWLFLAVKSWRLIVPIVLTLMLGLVLTAAFAALAVGTLNLVSVAFAILFVGLAVDFAIQFAVRFREALGRNATIKLALAATALRAGPQILVAALATSAGFLAFVPTDFKGVAQLGLIAGVGMLIAFICTLTALPALLALFRPAHERSEVGFHWARGLDEPVRRRRAPILVVAGVLAVVAAGLTTRLHFDGDPMHTKNQTTEAVRTLNDMAADPITNPYTIDVLTPSPAEAAALAARLRLLPSVQDALTIDSLVPEDQAKKLPLIQDAAGLLLPTLSVVPNAAPVTPDALRQALRAAGAQLAGAVGKLHPGDPLVLIAGDLAKLSQQPDDRLMRANAALTQFLPAQLDLLRTALQAGPATRADIPPVLARDWVSADGQAKIQVVPKPSYARSTVGLHRFVAEVTGAAPQAGGAAVTIVRSTDTIVAAFRIAAVCALVAIAAILLVALRRVSDAARVMAPLLLSSLLTAGALVLLGLKLNFANIIALPLLLGVGVSFNVYFVMNWRAGRRDLLASPTARAVLLSALTTATAFGSLALSNHPGTSSMGVLLLISLGCTLVATFAFLPAVLAMRKG